MVNVYTIVLWEPTLRIVSVRFVIFHFVSIVAIVVIVLSVRPKPIHIFLMENATLGAPTVLMLILIVETV